MLKVKKTMEKEDKVRHMAHICLKFRYENQKDVNFFLLLEDFFPATFFLA